jgi:hypothetical protein
MGRKPKARGSGWVPLTPFQAWLDEALERKGWDLKRLAAAVDSDYANLWRVARGNPESYPGRKRVSVETVTAIGIVLGDVNGALKTSDYPTQEEVEPTPHISERVLRLAERIENATPEQQALVELIIRHWEETGEILP